ncbi:PDDEXK nuclease domain-containing protein [Vreelandella alkaliphila]|uniref:PDDEXK nuclease domain-containing protein n=1 Tax=Vreelandella alkaliphila TaxID=272774 RepID=A0AAJ2RXH9_9GAMM|nr:PDDEXK nuclease domain-containing protein [Halomonas alkaliphila]MDX5977936.1 PDDEXK nuclease domain-containing protein [Halomonas alkaliphila]
MTEQSPIAFSSLVSAITQQIEQARGQVRQAVNTAMVQSYWEIGRLIVEHEQQGNSRAEYGKQQLQQLSQQLTERLGKGFDVRNLRNMRQFYQSFPKRNAVRTELSWTHYRTLLRIENAQARDWYLHEAINQSWSARALERQINTLYYERLLASQDKSLVEAEAQQNTQPLAETAKDYLRDPYILDFLNLQDKTYQESQLEQAIISNLQQFLLELGKGFAFVERQQRIRFDDEDFYIDLVFYNFKLKCFLLVDLKLGKLRHQDIGQMDTYVRLYDEQRKGSDDNPTIGLVLCSEKSEAVVKYSVLAEQKQLFTAKYLPYLPSENELKRELERERAKAAEQLQQWELGKE